MAVSNDAGNKSRAPNRTSTPGLLWQFVLLATVVWAALLVRLTGPAMIDPDGHASALHFDRLVHGERLDVPLLSTPKPLLTLVHGATWAVTHDWRALTLTTILAFAVAAVSFSRAANRLAGPAAASAVLVALAGSAPLLLQVARGNSLVWALAGWGIALDALARRERRWALGSLALLAAGLARSETWILLPPLLVWAAVEFARGRRGSAWLLLALAAPPLWLAHDWLLTGDAFYSAGVPARYTDLIAGRSPVPPAAWARIVADRYLALPIQLGLGAVGLFALARRRAWLWLGALAVVGVGVIALLGLYANQGIYVSWRYWDPADLVLRLLAALGAAELVAGAVAAVRAVVRRSRRAREVRVAARHVRPHRRRVGRRLVAVGEAGTGPAGAGPPDGERAPAAGPGRQGAGRPRDQEEGPAARVAIATVTALLGLGVVVAALWPVGPFDPTFDPTIARGQRLSRNAATAITALRPFAADGLAITVSGPQRVRVALELERPLVEVRDLFLASLNSPADGAVAGTSAVFHDADADQPASRFTGLNRTTAGRFGIVELAPLVIEPERGLYVHEVKTVADPVAPVGGDPRRR
jgi:hypothetical protein